MTTHIWTTTTPGYTELRIGDRVRGYVEHATRLPFWNYLGRTGQGRAFSAIAPRGTYVTVEAAMEALQAHVARRDAICDGTRGIQGEHTGCSPARCVPAQQAS